ncbi:MAG: hypothetical protein V2A76_13945 [Planctomycetota bacterium]
MRVALLSLLFLLICGTCSAQIICATPMNERVEKRYEKYLTTYQGRKVIIGEPKLGIECSPGNILKQGGSEAKNEMFVADPADPSFVPYKWEDGKRVKNGKRSVCCFAGDDFLGIKYVDALQTLEGLAREYAQRNAEIEMLRETRDGFDKGSAGWFGNQGKMVARLDRLQSWLINMGYPVAAKKLLRKIDQEKKVVAREAVGIREKKALSSVKTVSTPAKLIEASEKISGGKHKFRAMESQHVRILYVTDLSDSEAGRGLELAEAIIEGFRKDFVDPYRDDDFRDYIPDGLFAEFCFVPKDADAYEQYKVAYYGVGWGNEKDRERSLKMTGNNMRGAGGTEYVSYWRLDEQHDVEGIIAHKMGHCLANLHYDRGSREGRQDWLEEAVGYYVSFGHLGRNSVTCFQWKEPSYAKPAEEAAEKTVQSGLRGYFNELALSKGPPIESLAIKTLADISDADFAKAWSMYDYIAMRLGREGQVWLRKTCFAAHSTKKGDFVRRWRTFSEEMFPVGEGVDVFHVIDENWREYAERAQSRD